MTTFALSVTFDPSANATDPIERRLHELNRSRLGAEITHHIYRVALTPRDETGAIVGGILEEMDRLYVRTLRVAEQRGQRVGGRQLACAKQVAVKRGLGNSHLQSTEYQALDRKQPREVCGTLEGMPAGSTWSVLKQRYPLKASGSIEATYSDEELHEFTDRV